MKKWISLLLSLVMMITLFGAAAAAGDPEMEALIAAAKAEGELIIYGSAEEPYIAAAA